MRDVAADVGGEFFEETFLLGLLVFCLFVKANWRGGD